METFVPEIHNPAKLYQEKTDNDRKARLAYKPPVTAPRDVVKDLHKEPEWLIPELRSWMSMPIEHREAAVRRVMGADEKTVYTKDVKVKCLRFVLSRETDRKLLILIVNYIAPAPKTQG